MIFGQLTAGEIKYSQNEEDSEKQIQDVKIHDISEVLKIARDYMTWQTNQREVGYSLGYPFYKKVPSSIRMVDKSQAP